MRNSPVAPTTSRVARDRSDPTSSSKKKIYMRVLELEDNRKTKEVQAALKKADAGRLLFGKP